MIVTMPMESALALVHVRWAASTDKQRPILCATHIEWDADHGDSGKIEATATNSYILANRRIDAHEALIVEDDEKPTGSVLVNAKDLYDAVVRIGKRAVAAPVTFVIDQDSVTVLGGAENVAETMPTEKGDFPKWRGTLEPGAQHRDPRSAFNAGYLNDLAKAAWAAGTDRRVPGGKQVALKAVPPIRFTLHGQLKPGQLEVTDSRIGPFYGIIMPVRVDWPDEGKDEFGPDGLAKRKADLKAA